MKALHSITQPATRKYHFGGTFNHIIDPIDPTRLVCGPQVAYHWRIDDYEPNARDCPLCRNKLNVTTLR